MSRTRLEIFPNLAVYQSSRTEVPLLDLPIDVYDVSAWTQGQEGTTIALVREGPLTPQDRVVVDGEEGTLISLGEKHVDLLRADQTVVRIHKPKIILSYRGHSKQYILPSETPGPIVVTGFIRGVTWTPGYTVILSSDPDLIQKFIFTGEIRSEAHPFGVDEILLNTRPLLASRRDIVHYESAAPMMAMRAASVEQPEELDLGIKSTYRIPNTGRLLPEMSFPLEELDQIQSPRLYFIRVEEGVKPLYGYSFTVPFNLPPGTAKVYNQNFELQGLNRLEILGRRVILKIGLEENLVADVIVERSRSEIETGPETRRETRYRETTDYSISILSQFEYPVPVVVELPIQGTLVRAQPNPQERLPGRLVWNYQIVPGDNNITGQVVTEM